MSEIRAELPASVTHAYRAYTLVAPAVPWADAHLTIQVGRRGPRGGMAGLRVESYDVQEEQVDPRYEFAPYLDRVFLLAKQTPAGVIYLVTLFGRGGPDPSCTCDGHKRWGACKHEAALSHAVYVRGWRSPSAGAVVGAGGPGL